MPPNLIGMSLRAKEADEDTWPEVVITHRYGTPDEEGTPDWGYLPEEVNVERYVVNVIEVLQTWLDRRDGKENDYPPHDLANLVTIEHEVDDDDLYEVQTHLDSLYAWLVNSPTASPEEAAALSQAIEVVKKARDR